MKKITLLALLISLSFACQNNSPADENTENTNISESESLKKEVMDIHDEVMPQMTPMGKLQGQLQEASIGAQDSIAYMTAAQDLKFAKQAMMEWMRNFSSTFNDNMSEEEKVAFLTAEKNKMQRIDSLTKVAIDQGQEIFTAIPVAQDSL
jgi:hypothetical protein